MRVLGVLFLMGVTLLLAACGPTAAEVIEAYKPKVEEMRGKLARVMITFPALGSAQSGQTERPAVPPLYDTKASKLEVAFLSVEEITDGSEPEFNLSLTSDLSNAMAWTGPRNPMAPSVMEEAAGDLDQTFERALATPYAVIYRPVLYEKPVAVSPTEFHSGHLDLEAFLIEVDNSKLLATCRLQAVPESQVDYVYKPDDDPKGRLEAFASSTMWSSARDRLAVCLRDVSGGTFVFD